MSVLLEKRKQSTANHDDRSSESIENLCEGFHKKVIVSENEVKQATNVREYRRSQLPPSSKFKKVKARNYDHLMETRQDTLNGIIFQRGHLSCQASNFPQVWPIALNASLNQPSARGSFYSELNICNMQASFDCYTDFEDSQHLSVMSDDPVPACSFIESSIEDRHPSTSVMSADDLEYRRILKEPDFNDVLRELQDQILD